jgi:HNH endonuclease
MQGRRMSEKATIFEALAAVMADVSSIGKNSRNQQQNIRYKHLPFWQRVAVGTPEECWPWLGASTCGYGALRRDGRFLYAHRVAWEFARGPIADGLTIDHLCRTRLCCNPAHMEPVTRAENARRGERTRLTRRGGNSVR